MTTARRSRDSARYRRKPGTDTRRGWGAGSRTDKDDSRRENASRRRCTHLLKISSPVPAHRQAEAPTRQTSSNATRNVRLFRPNLPTLYGRILVARCSWSCRGRRCRPTPAVPNGISTPAHSHQLRLPRWSRQPTLYEGKNTVFINKTTL